MMTDSNVVLLDAPNRNNLAELEPQARCKTCLYSDTSEINPHDPANRTMYCRFNPPAVMGFPTSHGLAVQCTFPVVSPEMWCGQHEDREVAKKELS